MYKAKAVIVKDVRATKLKIVFYDARSIYVHDENVGWVVFHKWFAPKGSYGAWRNFRHLLLTEKKTDLYHCYRVAHRWGIASQCVKKCPDLSGLEIEERISV